MLNKMKISNDENGSGPAIVLLLLVFILLAMQSTISNSNTKQLKYWYNNAAWGMQQGTKAALLEVSMTNENVESIGQGYLIKEDSTDTSVEKYNHFFKLNHSKAIDTFFKYYYLSMKHSKYEKTNRLLEKATIIAILEPDREILSNIGTTTYYLSIYNSEGLIKAKICSNIDSIEQEINDCLSTIKIRLFDTENKSIIDLQNKTYFIAATENLEIPSYDNSVISLSEFQGSNLMRNTSLRGD